MNTYVDWMWLNYYCLLQSPKSGVVYCVVGGINLVYGRFGKNTLNVAPLNIDVGER